MLVQNMADQTQNESPQQRVLVLAPTGRDAHVIAQTLTEARLRSEIVSDMAEFCRALGEGAGAAVVAEEALAGSAVAVLTAALAEQPPWSDIPLIVLTAVDQSGTHRQGRQLTMTGLSVTLLERPLRKLTLISTLEAALRARRRQYQLREILSQYHQSEQALRLADSRFRGLVEATSDVLYQMSPDWSEMRRLTSRDFLAETTHPNRAWMEEYIHPDDRPHVLRVIKDCIRAKAVFELEHRVRRPDGSMGWTVSRAVPLLDENGDIIEWFGAASDITERKRAEEALQQAVGDLKRSNQDLEQFAYVASHDLREPLRMVTGFMDLLRDRYRDQLDDTAQRFIAFAVDGTRRMEQLLSGLMEYSRVSTSGQDMEPVSMNEAFNKALANLWGKVVEIGGEVTAGELPTVLGNATQMTQLLQNLLANAIKFRRQDVPPRVHASAKPFEENTWLFSVQDNGIGMDKAQAQSGRIFQVFQRLNTREEYEGTGVGLAICKRIVERHGGRIWVESEPGRGSTFFFTLPKDGRLEA
ncbi:MAG: PAS domain-containing protein [Planctomycetes bacterium]|nr:PAS domain-containing protein [Planctomycetota bacterium]